jgi:hypothetical protein
MRRVALVVFVLTLLSGCAEPGAGATKRACDHFLNVRSDFANGLLTEAELRTKLREVNSRAEVASDDAVKLAGRNMLAAITAGDSERLLDEMGEMVIACREAS